ncbi:conserved hypothetical protein [Pseudomonas sp. PM2]
MWEASGFLLQEARSTGAAMQDHAALGVHFALAIITERLLWLTKQRGTLALIVIKRQAATAQGLQGQLLGFLGRIGTQLRGRLGRTTRKDRGDK